jgi:hypothetical protein
MRSEAGVFAAMEPQSLAVALVPALAPALRPRSRRSP